MKSFLAFVAFLFLAVTAAAQDANPNQAKLDQLTSRITAIETAITEKAGDDAALVKLQVDLDTFSKALIDFGVSLRPRIAEINQRLDELGQPPKQGEPAEPEIVTRERTALQQEKALNNAFLGSAESLSIRASKAITRIGDLRRTLFTDTLFQRTDIGAAIGSGTWGAFTGEMQRAWDEVSSRLRFMFKFRPGSLFAAVGLSLVVGLATFLAVRRALGLMAETGDKAEDAAGEYSYIARLSLAFWSTVIPSLAFAASLGAIFALFVYFDVLTVDTLNLAEALLISAAGIFFIQRLANALFAPRHPERRLIVVSDRAAGFLVALAVALAVIHVLDYFLGRVFETLSSPLVLTVVKSLASSLAISLVLILVATAKPFHDRATGAARGWPRLVRLPLLMVAIFIIGAAAIGYVGLARFTAAQIVYSGAILATMYIGVQSGQVLAAESVFPRSPIGHRLRNMFQLSDTALDQLGLLLSFVVYLAVLIVGLPLILLQWGFNKLDIQTWLFRILTDIRIGTISISLVGIVFGLAIFVLGFLLTRRFQRWLDGAVMARSRVDLGVRNSVRTIVGYVGIVFAAMIALSAAGFDLSSLALVAGALSLGVGFGLQNIVSNFVSGLILLAERPFKAGDWIVAGGTAGFVRKISVRATEIETFQHQTVILPNSELINSAVGNWTHHDRMGRLEIKVGTAYGVNPRKVHDLLLDIARADSGVLADPAPIVLFNDFGASSLDFELRVHIAEIFDGLVIGNRLRFEIYDAFERNNIPIPFPQRDVNLKLPDLEALGATIAAARQGQAGGDTGG